MEEKLETVQKDLREQKQINRIQQDEISLQRSLIDLLQAQNSELKLKLDESEQNGEPEENLNSDHGKTTLKNMAKEDVKYPDLTNQTETKIRVDRQEREQIAFSAYLNRDLSNLGPGHTIQYGATRLNEGNAFNAQTGIFTVPHDGVYLFAFACEDYHNHRIYADIYVDGACASLVLEGPSGVSHAMGTNVVILRLTKGQAVWVAIDAGGQDDILQNTATTFSGVFLYY